MVSEKSYGLALTSPEQMADLANAIAPVLGPGSVLLLSGEVGSGKTHFARTIIQTRLGAAGVIEDVPSPTFTLVQTYSDGICEIWHADLYRLSQISEIEELGLIDAFEGAVCLIEWPDRLGNIQAPGALSLNFSHSETDNARHLTLRWHGSEWDFLPPILGQYRV